MFIAENEDVLVSFQSLCTQYPRENPVALWEMAGGQVAAQQSVQRIGGTLCPECGVPQIVEHRPNCSHYEPANR